MCTFLTSLKANICYEHLYSSTHSQLLGKFSLSVICIRVCNQLLVVFALLELQLLKHRTPTKNVHFDLQQTNAMATSMEQCALMFEWIQFKVWSSDVQP